MSQALARSSWVWVVYRLRLKRQRWDSGERARGPFDSRVVCLCKLLEINWPCPSFDYGTPYLLVNLQFIHS